VIDVPAAIVHQLVHGVSKLAAGRASGYGGTCGCGG
jgi:hypothetical protein